MKYPAYPKYKDSGVEWLGEIPAEWEIKKLSILFSAKKGSNAAQLTKEYCATKEGEFPVFSGQTENDGIMALINTYEFDSGRDGFLFSTTVGAKAMSLMHIKGKFSLSQNCMVIIPLLNFIDIRFFYYHMQPLFSFERGLIPEHMQASFRMEDLYAYRIALPPRSTQQSISTFLDTETAKIDGLIKDYEELISLLQEKRQALISHAVSRGLSELVSPDDPEFGEWAKPVDFKDSGVEWLGEIPQDWNISESRWLFSERKERAGIDDRQVTASQKYGIIYQEEFMEMENQKVMLVMKDFSILKKVKPNDFVISMRSFQGGLEISEVEGCMSSAYIALIPDLHFVNPSYFKWAFKSVKYIQALQNTTNLVRDGQALRYGNFTQIKLPVIPINEQKAIGSFLEKEVEFIDSLCVETQDAISLLKEHRSALITNAVTGKINVEALV